MSRLYFRPRLAFSFLLLTLATVLGCGGGGDENTTTNTPPPPQNEVIIPNAPPASQPPAVRRDAAPQPKKKKPSGDQIAEDDQDDVFVYGNEANYTQLDDIQKNQYLSERMELASLPPSGVDSTSFRIVESGRELQPAPRGNFRLPDGFEPLADFGYAVSGWPLRIRCVADNAEMVYVPEGVFVQGKTAGPAEVTPQLNPFLGHYYIDAHEVTVRQFRAFFDAEKAAGNRNIEQAMSSDRGENFPATGVLWRNANSYAEKYGKALPTEAQWEKAARGPEGFDHPWGFGRPAWHHARNRTELTPVMDYPTDRSPYDVMDMAGNGLEWCADWYAADTYQKVLADEGQTPRNYVGPRTANPKFHRVVKGGDPNWNLWARSHLGMSDRDPRIGFRCVLNLEPSTP